MNYIRVGNRTLTQNEYARLTPSQIRAIEESSRLANEKRLENIRKGLGIKSNTQNVTIDVTPQGVAKMKAAIAAEEEKIAAETQSINEEVGSEGQSFVSEAEQPASTKKSKKKSKTAENIENI
jgi:hypothetical protein